MCIKHHMFTMAAERTWVLIEQEICANDNQQSYLDYIK